MAVADQVRNNPPRRIPHRRWSAALSGLVRIAGRAIAGGCLTASLLLAAPVALATSTGACTASAQTPKGTFDLATTPVLHLQSTDHVTFTATAPTPQDTVRIALDVLGYPVELANASGLGAGTGGFDLDASTVGQFARSAEIAAVSSGPSGSCTVSVQLVIDDVATLGTPVGIAAATATAAGAVALAAGLLLSLAAAPLLILLAVVLLAAGASTLLQQLAGAPVAGLGEPAFAAALARPIASAGDVTTLAVAAGAAVFVAITLPFPSELFNRTVEKHRDAIRAWFARLPVVGPVATAGGAERGWSEQPPTAIFAIAFGGILAAALDPAFGASLGTALAWAGASVAIIAVVRAHNVPRRTMHRARAGDRGRLSVVIGALPVAVAGVLISRATGYQPGYLYGLIVGYHFASQLSAEDEGRTVARGGWWMLVIAGASWLLLQATRTGGVAGTVPGTILAGALGALTVTGIEGVVFAFVPLSGLPGADLFRWSRLRWGLIYVIAVFAYAVVILNPANGFSRVPQQASFQTSLGLFVGFGLFSVAFWAFFTLRDRRAATPAPPSATPPSTTPPPPVSPPAPTAPAASA